MPARRNARSTRYCRGAAGDALTVGAHEQRRRRRPGGQSPAGGGAPFGRGGEAGGPAVEIALEDPHQHRFDRDPAVLAALAADVDDGAIVGAPNVTDVGAHQFIGAQPGQQRSQDQGAVALDPVAAPPRLQVEAEDRKGRGHRIRWYGLRQRLRQLRPANQWHRIRRKQLGGVEKRAQQIPRPPAPLNRRRLMGLRIPRKPGAQGVRRDGAQRHPRDVIGLTPGDEGGDGVEVLAIGLDGVHRGFPGTPVGEKGGEPVRSRTVDTVSVFGGMVQQYRPLSAPCSRRGEFL
jgi:hypothetical protein